MTGFRAVAILVLLLAAPLAAAAPVSLLPQRLRDSGAAVSGGVARLDAGRLVLEREPGHDGAIVFRLPLPADLDLSRVHALDATTSVVSADAEPVRLRWLFLDDAGRPVRQHGWSRPPGGPSTSTLPLSRFRWANDRVGRFDEARTLALHIESPAVRRLAIDTLRLLPVGAGGSGPYLSAAELTRLAFTEPPVTAEAPGVLVALEVAPNVSPDAARQVLDDTLRVRSVLRRLLGPALRPLDDDELTAVLLFRTDASRAAFFERLGVHFGVSVVPPRTAGYTVQTFATAIWDPRQGPRRPVILHEAVHAALAHETRLLPGLPAHAYLHEGIASYLQLCVYPHAIDPRFYPAEFRIALERGLGTGRFLPLRQLIGQPADAPRYPQLAALIAALLDRRPDALHALIRLAADGVNALDPPPYPDPLARPDPALPPLDALEADFLDWGRTHFLPDTAPPADTAPAATHAFPPLPELPPRR